MSGLTKSVILIFIAVSLSACDLEVIVNGSGTVKSDPNGINCGNGENQCVIEDIERLASDPESFLIKLNGYAAPGYRLDNWAGDCVYTSGNRCYVRIDDDYSVTANFVPEVEAAGSGLQATVKFAAMGDWGTGSSKQYAVANALKSVCSTKGCDYVIGLGDNFYDEIVSSAYSPAFENKFELPYQNVGLPFFNTLGNHDCDLVSDGDGLSNANGDVQVEYSYRTDRMSDQWKMPARYYHYAYPQNASTPLVDMFALDTNPYVGGPDDDPRFEINKYKNEQASWFNSMLASSTGTWKIAYGHHPFISNGNHGNAGLYEGIPPLDGAFAEKLTGETFRSWMEENICGKADLYINGHDHNLQILKPAAGCGKTLFVVSGTGSKANELDSTRRNDFYFQRGEQIGFTYFSISGNTLTIEAYGVDENTGTASVIHSQVWTKKL